MRGKIQFEEGRGRKGKPELTMSFRLPIKSRERIVKKDEIRFSIHCSSEGLRTCVQNKKNISPISSYLERRATETHQSLTLTSRKSDPPLSKYRMLSIRHPIEILRETTRMNDSIERGLVEGSVEKDVWDRGEKGGESVLFRVELSERREGKRTGSEGSWIDEGGLSSESDLRRRTGEEV
jgi:hypothetical protein